MRTKQANTAQLAVRPIRKGNYIRPLEDVSRAIERLNFSEEEQRVLTVIHSKRGV